MITDAYEGVSDAQVALRAHGGCPQAFEALVRRHRAMLVGHLRRRTATPQDAEDLAQDTFLKASRNLHRYDPRRSFVGWLLTIGTRLAISHARARRVAADIEAVDPAGRSPDPRALVETRETVQNLWTLAQQRLTFDQYRAMHLRYVRELNIGQIAREMKRTKLYVRVLLFRARQRLLAAGGFQETR